MFLFSPFKNEAECLSETFLASSLAKLSNTILNDWSVTTPVLIFSATLSRVFFQSFNCFLANSTSSGVPFVLNFSVRSSIVLLE